MWRERFVAVLGSLAVLQASASAMELDRYIRSEPILARENVDYSDEYLRDTFAVSPQDDTKLNQITGSSGGEGGPHKLMVGDWIAQYDTTYSAWFFYNIKTEESTWIKPKELHHVVFNSPPTGTEGSQSAVELYGDKNQERDSDTERFGESEPGEFFGFDTSPFSSYNLARTGLVGSIQDSFTGIYDNIVKDYVTSVFTDSIEGYVGATIKLVGWFLVGSMILIFGALINFSGSSKRSFSDNGVINLNLPFLQGVDLEFPVDDTMFGCYKDRDSCVKRDLQGEIGHLVSSVSTVKDFMFNWLEFGEKIGHMAMEGDAEDDDDLSF